jgi:Zn-dependent metalloprotease
MHIGEQKTYDFGRRRTLVEIVMMIMARGISYVHYDDQSNSSGYDNAFWNGRAMTYGDGNNDVLTYQ